jgi:hypothetical protein
VTCTATITSGVSLCSEGPPDLHVTEVAVD